MNPFVKKSIAFVFGLAAMTFFDVRATAYVLSGPHILDLVAKALGTSKSLSVTQKRILYTDRNDNNLQTDAVALNETLWYKFPEYFRSEISSEHGQKIHVVSPDQALTVIREQVVSLSETWLDPYKDVLLYRKRVLLQEKLTSLGVDVSISSLGRFQGKIAYIVGAKYPDESFPQLWIEKDTFRPLRFLLKENSGDGESLEFRYLKWQQKGNIWYPIRIEFYQRDTLVRLVEVSAIKVNPVLAETLFDIEYLRSIYPAVAPAISDEHETDDMREVQKTIEDFTKIFE